MLSLEQSQPSMAVKEEPSVQRVLGFAREVIPSSGTNNLQIWLSMSSPRFLRRSRPSHIRQKIFVLVRLVPVHPQNLSNSPLALMTLQMDNVVDGIRDVRPDRLVRNLHPGPHDATREPPESQA